MKYSEGIPCGGRGLSIYDFMCWVIGLFLKLGTLATTTREHPVESLKLRVGQLWPTGVTRSKTFLCSKLASSQVRMKLRLTGAKTTEFKMSSRDLSSGDPAATAALGCMPVML